MTPARRGEARCRSSRCNALLRFARNADTGKWIPLDHRPLTWQQAIEDQVGVYTLDPLDRLVCHPWNPLISTPEGTHYYRSHFRTCHDVEGSAR